MSKKILFILLLISSVNYAQLSNKHWIPPLHARDGNVVNEHYIYLSTPYETPFEVTVTNGSGTPVFGSPFTISQSNPRRIFIGNTQPSLMFLEISDVNIVKRSKGLILEASKEFYVSFKVRSANHAEILVPKGKNALGTSFRLGSLPQQYNSSIRNFVSSFMATEDNTNVNLSDYDTGVTFASGTGNVTTNSQTFNLDAGDCVVVSGYTNLPGNLTGFVGALLTSDKPIVVNTGNATGGLGPDPGNGASGQDFNLDQIVGYNNIGSEYVVVKGNGSNNTEKPLIIATEDNTKVYINGSPGAITTLNAGDYFLIPTSNYLGAGSNKNMYINSDKDVYVYQILGGQVSDATSGLNFIPPLSCYWQKSVNMIPDFNLIGNFAYNDSEIIVVTKSGATVNINGNSILSLPNTVTGNSDWETYRVAGLFGDIVVESTEALAVGVFGSDGNAAGFGGYYSGFGSEPEDTNLSLCSNQTIDLFDAIDGNPITGGTWTPALSSGSNIFDPALDLAGTYTYNYNITCDGLTVPESVDITVTIEQAPFVGNNNSITICESDALFDLYTSLGTGAVTGGTWSPPLTSGTGIFDPAVDFSATYIYTVNGNGVCATASATIIVTNNPKPTIVPIIDYRLCDDAVDGDDTNGSVNFDLTLRTTQILGTQTGITVTYHTDPNEANLGQNAISNITTTNRVIYVRLTNNVTGCFSTTSFNLIVKPLPVIDSIVELKQCDTDSDAITDFNLTQANIKISTDATYVYSYHNSPLGALNNTDFVTNEIFHTAANGNKVWARITNTLGCTRTAEVNLVVSATTIPQTYMYTIPACDDYLSASDPDDDGIDYFDLTLIEPLLTVQFPSGQSYTYSYYLNEPDATAEQNAIVTITNFRNTIANNQTIWVRIESNLYECAGLGPYLRLVVNPLPDFDLGEDLILCIDPVTGVGSQTINATPSTAGSYSYLWTPTNSLGNSGLYDVTAAGTYAVVVTNSSTGCQFTDSVSVTTSSAPANLSVVLTTPAFSSGLATIEAIATGGFGIYEYSINAVDWQSSPIFSGLENGSYTIYARDIQGCDLLISDAIQTITYPNYFTPNGDGYNDNWVIRLPSDYNGLITIYDRYGKLIKQVSSYGAGWDGTFNGVTLPSTDYWFKVEYTENNNRKEFKSHFSLKR
jgi:gliding motility-associated-like protein